mmetsp:Transcript_2950/g.3958  ORF Transcript_2950/g.3958 Transcript_2950/m.3958 type:complete len:124 (-) Transcript_2950:1127-1498(-)
MGNCCPSSSSDEQQVLTRGGQRVQAFRGEGHRLGTVDETHFQSSPTTANNIDREDKPNITAPAPVVVDSNMTEEERAKVRADRAAAAEARLKKQGGVVKQKKKPSNNEPLRGPNSQPTMRWTS